MAYTKLTETMQARVRATLVHTQTGQPSAKLQRAFEEDHLARTLLGQDVEALEVRWAEMRQRPVTPALGGPPVTPPKGPPVR